MASKIVVNLDTSKEVFLNSKCKQNDDLILECNIFENGLAKDLNNCSVVIQALKADKTYIIQNTDIIKSNNKFTANLVRDFTRIAGKTEIEIVLTESSKQNTTFSFCLEVVGSVIRGAVESRNTVTILENLQDKIEEAGVVKQETEQLIEKGGAATKGDIQEVNAQLETIVNLNLSFINTLSNNCKVKLIGDSITAGVGGKGYAIGATNRIIIIDTIENQTYRESNSDFPCWANYLKKYCNDNFTGIDFKNNGIGGKSAYWLCQGTRLSQLVDDNEDIVFLQMATNDRRDCNTPADFKSYLSQVVGYIKTRCKVLVLMSAPPVALSQETYNFTMFEANKVIKEVAKEKGVMFISHYDNAMNNFVAKGVNIENLLADGVHPHFQFYREMWNYIQKELMIPQKVSEVDTTLYLDKRAVSYHLNMGSGTVPYQLMADLQTHIKTYPRKLFNVKIEKGSYTDGYVSFDNMDLNIDFVDGGQNSSNTGGYAVFSKLDINNSNVTSTGYFTSARGIACTNSKILFEKMLVQSGMDFNGILSANSDVSINNFNCTTMLKECVDATNSTIKIDYIPSNQVNNGKGIKLANSTLVIMGQDYLKIQGTKVLDYKSCLTFKDVLLNATPSNYFASSVTPSEIPYGKTLGYYTGSFLTSDGGYPTTVGGTLETERSYNGGTNYGYIREIFKEYGSTNTWIRSGTNSNTWTSWVKINLD